MSCTGLDFEFACLLEYWQLLNFSLFVRTLATLEFQPLFLG